MDEEPNQDASEGGTLEGTPGNTGTQVNGNVYQQPMSYAPLKSQVPKVFGAFMMIYGVIFGLFGIIGLFSVGMTISDYEEVGISISGLQTAWFYISAISGGVLVHAAITFGGYETYNYKRRGVMIGLGAIGLGLVFDFGDSLVVGGIVEQFLDIQGEGELEGLGALISGFGVVMSIVCAAVCGLLVAIPLLASGNDLE
ncbi:MAG TPA: hypothetical protein HA315_01360 [Candidatus Thalassarchaeaceae archaeon]|jgi:hypothetical protein|nr:MAG TPA: hypothetical protein D7H72_01355 [Candidatus Poseidoniales archaeon]HII34629.1 hypothetical protein [Candidatus Thalassarchaeaceae archaeon]|tara:strand:- start:3695 stop:4288 length:594 start_codon:yes stop_codon:yes gene_type:complete